MGIFDTAKQVATERRYTVDDIQRGVENPRQAVSELTQLYNHFWTGKPYNPEGIGVFTEDWDTHIILDACRYDEFDFESVEQNPKDLGYRT